MIDPRAIPTFDLWADLMTPDLEAYGTPQKFMAGDSWQDWAAGLLAFSEIGALGAPSPYAFDDWKMWAMQFIQLINQGG